MSQMVACPDCGTPNRVDAELCVQCWRGMSDLAARIPTPAFAGSSAAPPPPAPARPVAAPRPQPQPARTTIQAVTPREADPGAVPYFAAVGGAATPVPSFPLPSSPGTSTTTKTAVPWGGIATLTVLVALLAGGYLFFFGGKSGTYSPEDGAYSVTLPAGWDRIEELEANQGMDVAVESGSNQSAIMLFHYPVPGGINKEQMRAGMTFTQQFMPKFPGLTVGQMQESTVLTGEGVTAFEMSATASQGILPGAVGGRMRFVFGVDEGSPNLVMLMVACADADCPKAEATFLEMAKTFEFSD